MNDIGEPLRNLIYLINIVVILKHIPGIDHTGVNKNRNNFYSWRNLIQGGNFVTETCSVNEVYFEVNKHCLSHLHPGRILHYRWNRYDGDSMML